MFTHLNGVFAFVFWDKQKKSIFLARDGLGVKPIYYTEFNSSFAFASEIKALLELVPSLKELNFKALQNYLTFLWSPGRETLLKGVKNRWREKMF